MEIDKPHLFIEINNKNFIFFVVQYSQNLDFKILEDIKVRSAGVTKGQITDINMSSQVIKDNLNIIEKKIKYTFKKATIINDEDNFKCINVSGFKKLAGSQITNENISFILNNMKRLITTSEPEYSLIHLFNSGFILDKVNLQKLPIGLYGEFYNHILTFFLLLKNNIKNLKLVLNNCHLEIDRIIFKSFVDGIKQIKKISFKEKIILINISKNKSQISIFNHSSFVYLEKFDFGTDIIMRDVSKLCSLKMSTVERIFSEFNFNNVSDPKEEAHLPKKYFDDEIYRKISLSHFYKIISARTEEIINLIYKKNTNLNYFNNKNQIIHLSFEDDDIFDNLKQFFKKQFKSNEEIFIFKQAKEEYLDSCKASAELIVKGHEKEAIPVVQTKKSIISRIFTTIFE
jgi:cell division protein FtsA